MVYLDVRPNMQFFWMVPLGLLLSTVLALGIGMLVAPLNAISEDVQHLFRFIVRAGFFVSPVMWTYEMAHSRASGEWLDLILLNPMVVPITLVRKGLDGSELAIATEYIAYAVVFAFGTLILGIAVFKRWEAKVVKYL
jgi:ABC-2 type transport system permease protein